MGQALGILGVVLAFVFLGVAGISWIDASDLQKRHDQYCGGFMEALLDWDGNCEELRQYISELKTVSLCSGVFGLLLLVLGGRASSDKKAETLPQQAPIRLVQSQVKPHSTSEGYCTNCGTPLANMEANFCGNCGKGRQ